MKKEGPPKPFNNACKVFVSRIPSTFTEESLIRMVEDVTGQQDSIVEVGLVYCDAKESTGEEKARVVPGNKLEHKGFAFMQLKTAEMADMLIQQQTIQCIAKPSSKKKHRLYLSAVSEDRNEANFICFLWQQMRCPYGDDDCKFQHVGPGACLSAVPPTDSRKKTKCWEFVKKGSCKQGANCPFRHPEKKSTDESPTDDTKKKRSNSEKDCINWKTKGKCRKIDTTCPYRHDEAVRDQVLAKKMKKRQLPADNNAESQQHLPSQKKLKQPLSVRVFGLNYETTIADVREFFADCGTIKDVTFPTFEDSGRSKGYCEVLFTSPRAVDRAILFHETELHGRWLSIQSGKMLERQWQSHRAAA